MPVVPNSPRDSEPWWYHPLVFVAAVLILTLLCAIVAVLRLPFFNPFRVTDDVLKTLITGLATVIAGCVVGGCALFTAKTITAKIEDAKIEAQNELEKQRMAYQEKLELGRLASQRDSEIQKQKIELYKTLYNTRIEAVKHLSEELGKLSLFIDLNTKLPIPFDDGSGIHQFVTELSRLMHMYSWIFPTDITTELSNLHTHLTEYMIYAVKSDQPSFLIKRKEIPYHLGTLSWKISKMMKNHDLKDLVGDLDPSQNLPESERKSI